MNDDPKYMWLKQLGSFRDGLFVIVSIVYITGYTIWSLIAWIHKLGPVPVLDAQYFSAGVPPLLAITVITMFIRLLKVSMLEKWPDWVGSLSLKYKILINAGVMAFYLLLTAFILMMEKLDIPESGELRIVIVVVVLVLMLIAVLLLQQGELMVSLLQWVKARASSSSVAESTSKITYFFKPFVWIERGYKLFFLYLIPIIAIIVGVTFYINTLYPSIPQELGGARPRCVQLDLVKSGFSETTLRVLLPPREITANSKVVRSRELGLLFSGSNYLIVSVLNAEHRLGQKFDISRSAVNAIIWCDSDILIGSTANKAL